MVPKNCESKQFFVKEYVQRQILGQKNLWDKNILSLENVGKKIQVQQYFGSGNYGVKKNISGQKKHLGSSYLCELRLLAKFKLY